jgi:hypothetical protein
MSDSSPEDQEEDPDVDGVLGGGVAGPENGTSAGVDEQDEAAFGIPDDHSRRNDSPPGRVSGGPQAH